MKSGLLLSLFILTTDALALSREGTGNITGVVIHGSTREPLPSANVQVLETQRGAATDVDGRFTIEGLQPGTYQLRVSLVGYSPVLLSDIVVATGRPVDLVVIMDESAVDLDAVEVTASYFRKTPDATVSIQRLTNEEIRRSPGGFEDVIRAISVLPGVAQAQPGRNDLVVRGGAPSENLYVVDNIEIPNINHFGTQGAAGGPLSYFNLDFVRETAFSTGGFGVRYGDRMSSVLTLDLQDGRRDRIGGKATVSASGFGVTLQGPYSENGSFIFSARRSYLDLIFKAAGFSFVPQYYDLLGRAVYSLSKSDELTFLAVGAIDNVNFFNETPEDRYNNSKILGTDQWQYASGLSWKHLFGSGYATVSLGRSYVKYNGIQRDSLLNPIFTNNAKEGETSLRGDIVIQAGRHTELGFGAQIKRVRFDTQLALPGYVTTFGDTIDIQPSDVTAKGTKASAYFQVSQRLFERFVFTGGVRGDFFSLIDEPWSFAPRGALTYELSDLTALTASVGIYRQCPSYIWLVSTPANSALKQARVDQFIVGIEHLLRADLKVRVEGFQKNYTDYAASVDRRYLVLSNTGAGYGGSEENFDSYGLGPLVSGGTGEARGIEFLAQKKLSDAPWYGLVSISLSKTRFRALDGVERPGAYDQEVIVNFSGGYRIDERWEFSAKFRYASGQPYTPFNSDGTQNVNLFNTERVEAVHTLDLRVDRRWNLASWNLIVYLDVQNVFNNKFTGAAKWNSREQKVEMDESGIGILPTLGISAEF